MPKRLVRENRAFHFVPRLEEAENRFLLSSYPALALPSFFSAPYLPSILVAIPRMEVIASAATAPGAMLPVHTGVGSVTSQPSDGGASATLDGPPVEQDATHARNHGSPTDTQDGQQHDRLPPGRSPLGFGEHQRLRTAAHAQHDREGLTDGRSHHARSSHEQLAGIFGRQARDANDKPNRPAAQRPATPLDRGTSGSDGLTRSTPDLLTSFAPFDPSLVGQAVQRFLDQLDEIGSDFSVWLGEHGGAAPWLLAVATTYTAYEVARRTSHGNAGAETLGGLPIEQLPSAAAA